MPVPLMSRLISRLLIFPATFIVSSVSADSTIVFNEIMYHPATNEPALEWLELHNQMAVNMDVSEGSIEGGGQFQFPEGTVVPGDGYLVVAVSPSALAAATGSSNSYRPVIGQAS